jgi:PadR family transcriptional regulator, regulatory protein PadR
MASIPVDPRQESVYAPVVCQKEKAMVGSRGEVLQGTLDLIVLQTLHAMGPLHGYGIALRIQQVSDDLLKLNQGTLYPALLRLEQQGWISSKWGVSENNRKAKFYSLTRAGKKQLAREAQSWERMASVISRLLTGTEGA